MRSSTSGSPGSTSPRGTVVSVRRSGCNAGERAADAAGAPIGGMRNPIGFGMGAPTIVTHGTGAQKRRYLRPLFTGEEIWCQLFSEPGAGSDVAGLATGGARRRRVGGERAEGVDLARPPGRWGILLVGRTDPDVHKHKGLTYFVVDMRSPAWRCARSAR